MSAHAPYLFFAVVKVGQNQARRLLLNKQIQQRLTDEFSSQRDAFLAGSEPIAYDPQYHPKDGDEHFVLNAYPLPTALKKVIEGPDAIDPVTSSDFEEGRVRSVFGLSQASRKHELIFQSFDAGSVLERNRTFLARGDSFQALNETAVTLKSGISAYYDGTALLFRSVSVVSRYLDLEEVFAEATDRQLRTFLADHHFAKADAASFLSLSDTWVRRKVSEINARRVLDSVSIPQLKKVAAQFQVTCETAPGKDGDERVVLPTEKKELKNLLRLLAQDFLECALTDEKFRVNSKAKLGGPKS